MYALYVTPDISSSSENINSTVCVSRLSFRFLWLWLKATLKNVKIALSTNAFAKSKIGTDFVDKWEKDSPTGYFVSLIAEETA